MDSSEVIAIDARLRTFPGAQQRLEFLAPEEIASEIEFARLALDAVFHFAASTWEPLSVDLWLSCSDADTGYPRNDSVPPRPFWLLSARELPLGVQVRPAWEDEQVDVADELTPNAILAWLGQALDQECAERQTVGWRELLFRAARVRLPVAPDALADDILLLGDGAGIIEHPAERRHGGLWVSGPLPPMTLRAPVELVVRNEAGLLTLEVSSNWSVWADEGEPGYDEIACALERVHQLGWESPST
jgi:hypothetical protein